MASFFRFHRGHQFASSALMDPIRKTFVAALEAFARREQVPVIQFRKGRRKRRHRRRTPEEVHRAFAEMYRGVDVASYFESDQYRGVIV